MIPTDWPAPLGFALETTLGVTALVILVLLLRRPVAKRFGAGAAYALWALPLIRLVLPPLPSQWTLWRGSHAAGEGVASAPLAGSETFTVMVESGAPLVTEAALAAPSLQFVPEVSTASPVNWPLVLATVWGLGALIALARSVHRHWEFMKIVDAEAEDAGGKLQIMTDDTAAEIGLRKPVRVCKSLISSGPMVTGLWRPTVLLPAWFDNDYSREEQRAAIAHELTHVKRRDLWALQFAHVAMALQWFNPLAHYALRAFRSDQEAACDADVLRCTRMSPRAYGATLVKAVKLSHPSRGQLMAAGLPLTHAIKDRLVLMQNPQPSLRKKALGGSMIGLLGACAIMATASAHPPSTSIQIEDGELTIDGKTYDDRKFFLLDDPEGGARFHFEFEGDFEDLGDALAKEGEEIAKLFEDMDFSAMLELEGLEELEELAELEVLQELPDMLTDIVGEIDISTLEDGSLQIVIPKTEMNIEVHRKRAEEIADRVSKKAEAMVLRDKEIEVRIEALNARAEEFSKHAEARANAFSRKMEMRFAPTVDAIDDLAKSCAEKQLSDKPVIIQQKVDGQQREIKAVCVKSGQGDRHELKILERFIAQHPGLTNEEREAFSQKLKKEGETLSFKFELDGGPSDAGDHPGDLED